MIIELDREASYGDEKLKIVQGFKTKPEDCNNDYVPLS